MKKYLSVLPLLFLIAVPIIFFRQFFFQGKVPVPADALIGLYHPYRDLYSATNPNGIAYKNFLITDPIRQQYPWRYIAITSEKNSSFPIWNPYNGNGEPLFGNIQSAVLYPLNIVLFIMPFGIGWSAMIFLQLLLGAFFMYFYLKNRKLSDEAALLGSISSIFSGFWVAWLTWNTLVQAALWLPLALLSIDKITDNKNKKIFVWCIALIIAMSAALFAGHLQTYFYISLVVAAYAMLRIHSLKERVSKVMLLLGVVLNVAVIIFTQLLATIQLITLSARDTDQQFLLNKEGWFVPWQHLIQFVVPDFFGNPATLNYWGVWNYGEMIGYIGLIPLFFAFYALFAKKSKTVIFFASVLLFSLLFTLPTLLAKLPFLLKIPFIATSQPTRLMVLIDFSLCVLGAYGMNFFVHSKRFDRRLLIPLGAILLIIGGLWGYVVLGSHGLADTLTANLLVAKRNLVLPTLLVVILCVVLVASILIKRKNILFLTALVLLLVTTLDLMRFGDKFNPFVNPEYLFPATKTTTFLQEKSKKYPWRFLGVDYVGNQKRILPPNVTSYYKIYTIDTYNPLLLRNLQNYAAASEFGVTDAESISFNRIIALNNYESRLINLAGVKYVASLSDINNPSYTLMLREGETRVYQNGNVFPRAFMLYNYIIEKDSQKIAGLLLDEKIDLKKTAILSVKPAFEPTNTRVKNSVSLQKYRENLITLQVKTDREGLLLLTDAYYPTWKVLVDGKKADIIQSDLLYRGVTVSRGTHEVQFYTNLL